MKVVILDDWEKFFLQSPELNRLKEHFDVEVYQDQPSAAELIDRISDADVIIPIRERTKLTKDVLQELRNIKLIAQTGAGVAHIDMAEVNRRGIPVATTPGGSAAVVELIFGYMISYSRKLCTLHNEVIQGNWPQSVGLGLEGKTVGIIGLGKIGTQAAKIAKAFNMNVMAWGPRLTPERAMENEVVYSSLENLLQKSHFVILAVRLVPETHHMLSEEQFQLMRKDSLLINTSRGEIIDEHALYYALLSHSIGGAALDVFTQEPMNPNNPLLHLDNVMLTPHIGWKTDNMFEQFLSVAVDNIISFFINNQPVRIINQEEISR